VNPNQIFIHDALKISDQVWFDGEHWKSTFSEHQNSEIVIPSNIRALLIYIAQSTKAATNILPSLQIDLSTHHGQLEILILQDGSETLDSQCNTEFSIKIINKQSELSLHQAVRQKCNSAQETLTIINESNVTLNQWHHHSDNQKSLITIYNAKEHSNAKVNLRADLSTEAKLDIFSDMRHIKEETTSTTTFKCILKDNSSAVLTGKIFIDENCNKTQASFSSKHILASEKAHVFSRPQLEINSDDVICGHGSSTGFLQPEEIFYLESRGIRKDIAKKLLLNAFIHDSSLVETLSPIHLFCKDLLND
jgi:hypothetical protein